MTLEWLLPMLTAALVGSVHCVGMCGALVAVATDGTSGSKQRLGVLAGYQLARLASYVALGVIAGSLGRALDLAGRAAGLGEAAALVAGGVMLVGGLVAMMEAVGVGRRWRLPKPRLLSAAAVQWLGQARRRGPLARALLLGSASGLLPCGFLYAFALAAAATASPLGGALVMAALWLGSAPALLGFGLLIGSVLSRVKRYVPLLSAAAIFGMGVITLNARVNLPAFALAGAMRAGAGASVPAKPASTMPAGCPFHGAHAP